VKWTKPLAALQGHIGGVIRAVFAREGDRIVTASADSTARLWDRDGKPLATLQGHTGPLRLRRSRAPSAAAIPSLS
jgi:WD40 repeat protein